MVNVTILPYIAYMDPMGMVPNICKYGLRNHGEILGKGSRDVHPESVLLRLAGFSGLKAEPSTRVPIGHR